MMQSFKEFFDQPIPAPYKHFGHFGEGIYHDTIQEGLITSYPKQKVIDFLKDKGSWEFENVEDDAESGSEFTITCTTDGLGGTKKKFENSWNSQLKVFGYKVGKITRTWPDLKYDITLEPIYPTELTPDEKAEGVWYHITTERHVPKIDKIGLSPRESTTKFTHPGGRVYILQSLPHTGDTYMLNDIPSMLWSAKFDELNRKFHTSHNRKDYKSGEERLRLHSTGGTQVYQVSLPEGISVYYDPMFPSGGLGFRAGFVMTNIPSRYLKKVDRIS